ncbi:hypothetical protein ACVWXF_000757, partial [Thermostichus sp. MS-CIW-40]
GLRPANAIGLRPANAIGLRPANAIGLRPANAIGIRCFGGMSIMFPKTFVTLEKGYACWANSSAALAEP